MSIFDLFKSSPDPAQLSDWLGNMQEAFGNLEKARAEPNSVDVLAIFTLKHATGAMRGALKLSPAIARKSGHLFGEFRAYYECFWQLYLLQKFESPQDQERVQKLYAAVSARVDQIAQALFSSNPNIKKAIGEAFGPSYEQQLVRAVYEYIQGERRSGIKETGNLFADNVAALTRLVLNATASNAVERENLIDFFNWVSEQALASATLKNFDLRRARFLELPSGAYR